MDDGFAKKYESFQKLKSYTVRNYRLRMNRNILALNLLAHLRKKVRLKLQEFYFKTLRTNQVALYKPRSQRRLQSCVH